MSKHLGGIAASLLVLGLMAGCSTQGDFPPRQLPPAPANSVFVSRGDTVQTIADQYHVSAQDLISLNGLSPPYTLRPGQRLTLPIPHTYQVKAGDTVYGIARQMNLDMAEIIRLNGLQPPYLLRVGQSLQMPGNMGGASSQVATASPPAAPTRKPEMPPATSSAPARATRPSVETAPLDPPSPVGSKPVTPVPTTSHPTAPTTVKRGVEAESLPPPPAAAQPSGSSAAGGTAAPVVPATRQPAPTSTASTPAPTPVAPSPSAVVPAPTPTPQVATAPVLAKPDEAPPPRTAARFMWPLRGEIISNYGSKPGGLRNDGINIAAAQGTAVAAAESGIVAYAGNQLKSFGNLVLIRHDGGWVTVYAHLADIGVQQGQRVTRGQPIGTVGQTGNVRSPQLHFAVRKGDQVVDPMGQLEK